MVELVDVAGSLELVLTIVDNAGPPDPAEGAASDQPVRLASIACDLAYNDYQGSRGARGDRVDRNVVLKAEKATPAALR